MYLLELSEQLYPRSSLADCQSTVTSPQVLLLLPPQTSSALSFKRFNYCTVETTSPDSFSWPQVHLGPTACASQMLESKAQPLHPTLFNRWVLLRFVFIFHNNFYVLIGNIFTSFHPSPTSFPLAF